MKEYFTPAEVATMYQVTHDAVLKWIKSGKLQAVRTPGGHCRIPANHLPREMIHKYFQQHETGSVPYCWEYFT